MDADSRRTRDFAARTGANPGEAADVADLTRRLVLGEETAYRAFYETYFNRLSRYLLVVTAGDEEATREALQGALIRLVRYVKVFSKEDVFWSWLTVLARSALADNRRQRRRYLALLDRFSRYGVTAPACEADARCDERLAGLLEQELTSLPADERQLIVQKYLKREPVRPIAEGLRASEKAVESSLARIRQKLRRAVLLRLKNEQHS